MSSDEQLGPMPSDGPDERLDVPIEVAGELSRGEVDEALDGLKALVLVDDENGQERADPRPEHGHAAPRRGRGWLPQSVDAVAIDVPGRVDEGEPLGARLLAE